MCQLGDKIPTESEFSAKKLLIAEDNWSEKRQHQP
ncbi:hypothetical protein B6N60_04378 [Richelia sinica FACHB-800]|uniref:Uncharacterized protein n=1 Tax=Richelia sinica FACHB-800 TaxID=1357546 RepID=A0A975TCS8_9NOST|nr:hypothetical protein B6N60_04378 [Richelia sinica FACHB-800]